MRNDRNRKSPLGKHNSDNFYIKEWWILKLVGKSMMRNRICIVSKYLPKRYLFSDHSYQD